MRSAAVHSGSFHADEVFAIAILRLIYPRLRVVRSREPDTYNQADIRVDVGHEYNPEKGSYDHHQKEGAGSRANNIPYASAGLIWKHFGKKLVDSKIAFNYIDEKLIQPIDAGDNGVSTFTVVTIKPYLINDVIGAFNPFSTRSNKLFDKHFHKAVKFAVNVLKKELRNAKEIAKSHVKVLGAIQKSNGNYLVLNKAMPWKKTVIDESNIKFVIHPKSDGQWRLTGVPKNMNTFELRKQLPASWGGLENEELAQATGVSDAIFCHRKLFVASAKSKKGTIELAKLALKN